MTVRPSDPAAVVWQKPCGRVAVQNKPDRPSTAVTPSVHPASLSQETWR